MSRGTVRSLRGAACLVVVLASLVTGCGTATPPAQPPPSLPASPAPQFALIISFGGNCPDAMSVLDVTSGVQVARVPSPRGTCWAGAAGAASGDRSFFLGVGGGPPRQPHPVYHLRIDDHGKPVSLAPVPGSTGIHTPSVAVTPDGTRLAIPVDAWDRAGVTKSGIEVLDTRTGRHTTIWGNQIATLSGMSWAGDDRTLLFLPGSSPRVVDTRTARDLNRDSHDLAGGLPGQLISAVPGTDGRTIYTASTDLISTTAATATDVIAAQPITGHGPARVLYRRTYQPAPDDPGAAAKGIPSAPYPGPMCRDGGYLLAVTQDGLLRVAVTGGPAVTLPAWRFPAGQSRDETTVAC
jgi:hypothetical protein